MKIALLNPSIHLSQYTTATMAKGLRVSTKRANKSLLRQNVFGPIEAARKERLSAKLLELASKSSSAILADIKMVEDVHGGEREKKSMDFAIYAIFFLLNARYTQKKKVLHGRKLQRVMMSRNQAQVNNTLLFAYLFPLLHLVSRRLILHRITSLRHAMLSVMVVPPAHR